MKERNAKHVDLTSNVSFSGGVLTLRDAEPNSELPFSERMSTNTRGFVDCLLDELDRRGIDFDEVREIVIDNINLKTPCYLGFDLFENVEIITFNSGVAEIAYDPCYFYWIDNYELYDGKFYDINPAYQNLKLVQFDGNSSVSDRLISDVMKLGAVVLKVNSVESVEDLAKRGNLGYAVDCHESVLQLHLAVYLNFICHSSLEFKSSVTCCISNFLHSAMIEVTVTVEYDCGDACFESFLSSKFTNLRSLFLLGTCFHAKRRSANQSGSVHIINYLYIYLLVASEDRHTGTLCSTRNLIANSVLNLDSSF